MAIRIMYVEDDQSIQDLVSMHLILQGFDVRTSVNGEDAIRKLESESIFHELKDSIECVLAESVYAI